MSTGHGWNQRDPYQHGEPDARGVYPERGRSGRYSGGHQPHGHGSSAGRAQPYGSGQAYGFDQPYRSGQASGGAGRNAADPYGGDVRNDYGRAPADTDAGRGGAHKASVAAILIYVGLFVGLPLLIGLVTIIVAL